MHANGLETLLAVVLVAAIAPVIVAVLPGPKIPQVVVLIFGGILIGPQVFDLGNAGSIQLLSNIGLGFLFLLAGYELDPRLFRERAGRMAIVGWAVSALLSVGAVALLASLGFVRDFVPIGLALTTTTLGTLLPILQDNQMLDGKFGRYVLAAGAVGELFPIVAISLFLTKRDQFVAIGSLLAVGVVALLLTAAPRLIGERRLRALIKQGQRATAQSTLRWSIVLLVLLLVAAQRFGLDVVLGAMLAGMVLRSWTHRMEVDAEPLETKLEAVGYGIFIPLFFVASGMTLDIKSIRSTVAAHLCQDTGALAARRDDVHHRDNAAAADRAGCDRPAGWRHAEVERVGARRGGRVVGIALPCHCGGPASQGQGGAQHWRARPG
jgi:Kef-type K+ transport system membrane component KefB